MFVPFSGQFEVVSTVKKAVFWAGWEIPFGWRCWLLPKKNTLEKMRHTVDGRKPANHFRCIKTS